MQLVAALEDRCARVKLLQRAWLLEDSQLQVLETLLKPTLQPIVLARPRSAMCCRLWPLLAARLQQQPCFVLLKVPRLLRRLLWP